MSICYNFCNGYVVHHDWKGYFDIESKRLLQALFAISGCLSRPNLSVVTTVKDQTAIKEEMLNAAVANAKQMAENLCQASVEKIKEFVAINYDWGELDVYSHTSYRIAEDCLPEVKPMSSIEMEPDDIDVGDSVTYV